MLVCVPAQLHHFEDIVLQMCWFLGTFSSYNLSALGTAFKTDMNCVCGWGEHKTNGFTQLLLSVAASDVTNLFSGRLRNQVFLF